MKKSKRTYKTTAAAVFGGCFAAGLFLHPEAAAAGVSDGLVLCARVIIPSLFPFIALSAFLSKSGVADRIGRLLAPLTRAVLHMPGCASCAVIMGMLGGYPVGGKMIAELCREKKINRREARRLFLYCVNPGPAFAISAVGASVLGSRQSGLIIFASLIASSIFIGIVSGIVDRREPISDFKPSIAEEKKLSDAYVEAVADASAGIYGICAWIVIFSAVIALVQALPLPRQIHNLIACVLECSRGISSLGSRSLPALAAILAWGGVCVHCQLLPCVLKSGVSVMHFVLGRAIHSAAAFAAAKILSDIFPQSAAVFGASAQHLPAIASSSVPAAVGLLFMSGLLILDVDRNKKIC